jgi:Rod binding domain-containing protein
MQLTTASGNMGLDPYEEMRRMKNLPQAEQAARVAGQFEQIFLKQFLSESLKPMTEGVFGGDMPGGDIYKSMIVDTLADGIGKGGGLGLSNVLQLQLQQLGPKGVTNDSGNHA